MSDVALAIFQITARYSCPPYLSNTTFFSKQRRGAFFSPRSVVRQEDPLEAVGSRGGLRDQRGTIADKIPNWWPGGPGESRI